MTTDIWLLILQTALIVAAIGASFVRTRERIASLETTTEHLKSAVKQIPGMSRAIARLEGQNK